MKQMIAYAAILIALAVWFFATAHPRPSFAADNAQHATPTVEALQTQIKQLQGLVPDQAAVMSHVGYHFSNLWFAIEKENWPLADFYLGETRNNVKWAVRAKPFRKNSAGQTIDLAAIAQAVDNGPFTDLKKAIDAKQKAQCEKIYDDTLTNCYACHKASEKPYLRPQRPAAPEAPIINADPNASFPQ
jgi:hypothetical protein